MKQTFIITAISYKHHNRCVSGISSEDGKHYRLISEFKELDYSVPLSFLNYSNHKCVKILDEISLEVVKKNPMDFQPENILINWAFKPILVKSHPISILEKFETKYHYVFFNQKRLVNVTDTISESMHSLELIFVDKLVCRSIKIEDNIKHRADFIYNKNKYRDISITDPLFLNQYGNIPYLEIKNARLLISLGVEFHDAHYKLISSIFFDKNNVNDKIPLLQQII